MEAIVLAGGFGTRLQSVVADLPKPMAPIGYSPFLSYIFHYLIRNGITKVILSTGYLHHKIEEYYGTQFNGLVIVYSKEESPLGTGGAIKLALSKAISEQVFIINGDTFFNVSLSELAQSHKKNSAELTLALKPMINFDRYGTVNLHGDKIISFEEKKKCSYGLINGGVYLINSHLMGKLPLPERFSFETDFMAKHIGQIDLFGYKSDTYFIDIGIPEDYVKAQVELGDYFEEGFIS